MLPENCITDFQLTGACGVDLQLLKEHWHDGVRIYKIRTSIPAGIIYQLAEWNPKKKVERPLCKIQISEGDALRLIQDLKLESFKEPLFGSELFGTKEYISSIYT